MSFIYDILNLGLGQLLLMNQRTLATVSTELRTLATELSTVKSLIEVSMQENNICRQSSSTFQFERMKNKDEYDIFNVNIKSVDFRNNMVSSNINFWL